MRDWFKTSLGQWLVSEEMARCGKLVPAGYYPTALQLGLGQHNYLEGIEIGERFLATGQHDAAAMDHSNDSAQKIHLVRADAGALPFSDKTHSLIVMPHVLDFCDDPHAVLREVRERQSLVARNFQPNAMIMHRGVGITIGSDGYRTGCACLDSILSAHPCLPTSLRYRTKNGVINFHLSTRLEIAGGPGLALAI